ncbi:sulfotransferase [Candidatus Thiosymbion oneisti]|uniref:sulfotransferase n=1 Tax=Candidatus Thiosymbion oneisti TaxID=589554 RepID=UPI000B09F491|nr:sulfotransferase [Candidatus Thiosymbion oneisti]
MYDFPSRVLHRLALSNAAILETSFDIERKLFSKKPIESIQAKHVFVSGLARSGTTMLMQALYDSKEFSSLTYRDMPFVLAPNTWAKVTRSSQRHGDDIERAHGDGIQIGFDSPEALEEVFWRVFGGDYIREDRLVSVQLADESVAAFRVYVDLINQRYNKTRYLSKNNNNVLRLAGLPSIFPNAIILVPFRDPIKQARSLLTQHRRFIDRNRYDRFAQRYMTWLVHHEFGRDHRPFEWGAASGTKHVPTALEYWLAQWVGVYRFLMEQVSENDKHCVFVCYERLCEQSSEVWSGICKLLDIPPQTELTNRFEIRNGTTQDAEASSLLSEAYSIYETLLIRSSKRILS